MSANTAAIFRKLTAIIVVAILAIIINDLWVVSVFPMKALPEIILLSVSLIAICVICIYLFMKHSIYLITGSFVLTAFIGLYNSYSPIEISNRFGVYSVMVSVEEIHRTKTENNISCEEAYRLATIKSSEILRDPYSEGELLRFKSENGKEFLYSRGLNSIDEGGSSIGINHPDVIGNVFMYDVYRYIRNILSLSFEDDLSIPVCVD